jgi:hypothetical protein
MRSLIAICALFLAPLVALAAAPPACVTVSTLPDAAGTSFSGSGTCFACEENVSLVVTNNHVLSPGKDRFGRFVPPASGTACRVTHGTKTYSAKVLAADQGRDLCAVVVDARLPVADLAPGAAPVGSKVTRYGNGTGEQAGTVVPHDSSYTSPSMHFVVRGRSASGDSGSAYFNERGQVVAVHCGLDGANNPRGVPVTYVRVWVREVAAPRFPKLRELLEYAAKRAIDWLFDRVLKRRPVEVAPVAPGPLTGLVPKAAPPVVTYRLVTYRDRFGRLVQVWEPVRPAGACPLPNR